jgi:hypothetical protein
MGRFTRASLLRPFQHDNSRWQLQLGFNRLQPIHQLQTRGFKLTDFGRELPGVRGSASDSVSAGSDLLKLRR